MSFCIESPSINEKSQQRLIEAKTCFNRINLPEYESKLNLQKAINIIIDNDTNYFGRQ